MSAACLRRPHERRGLRGNPPRWQIAGSGGMARRRDA
jgi:hypothetical protein